jgi:hypothetical protein
MATDKEDQQPDRAPTAGGKPGRKPSEWCSSALKPQIKEIVGKRIMAVVVKENPRLSPPRQVFLIFDDETNFEFYSNSEVTWTSGVRPGGIDWVRNYGGSHKIRFERIDPNAAPASKTPQ